MIIWFLAVIAVFIISFGACALLSLLMGLAHSNDPVYPWFVSCLIFGIWTTVIFIVLITHGIIVI